MKTNKFVEQEKKLAENRTSKKLKILTNTEVPTLNFYQTPRILSGPGSPVESITSLGIANMDNNHEQFFKKTNLIDVKNGSTLAG